METASLSDIKKELKTIAPEQLQELCLRLAKYKKENKELLNYLLFEAINEQAFIQNVKDEIDAQFKQLNGHSFYLAKKTLRKVIRTTDKYIKFSGSKETEIELLIYFCLKMKKSGLNLRASRVIFNMYQRRVDRVKKVLSMLHEDLQFDYEEAVENL
jgi:Mor family transcriptional regulator